jgi:hypothetical protein
MLVNQTPRRTCQFTSGRRSSQVMAPSVASSMSGQRSAGTTLARQLETVWGDSPIFSASKESPPQRFIAFCSEFIQILYTKRVECTHDNY